MRFLAALLALSVSVPQSAPAPTVVENDDYLITTITDGVYALRHKKAIRMGTLCGNTTVVIGDREVLAVDSCGLPSLANDDIAMIRKWTSKPVRYLVNTHWHGDHSWGNADYMKAFPGLSIIAHPETVRQMSGYLPTFREINADMPARIQAALASKVDLDGAALSAEREAEIRAGIPAARLRAEEFKTLTVLPPTVTVEGTTRIDLGGRIVEIHHLGRGNTGGDVVVFLPRERVVAAGDLLVYPFPFLLGGYPAEWSRTLDRLVGLGATTIVPGHGAVLSGEEARVYPRLIVDLLGVVSAAVQRETFARDNGAGNLAAVMAAVTARPEVVALRQRFIARNPDLASNFDAGLRGLITSAYRESWGG